MTRSFWLLTLAATLGLSTLSAQTRPLFAWPLERDSLPLEAGPCEASAVGDVNGDGAPDLLVALARTRAPVENFRLFLNDGRGSLALAPFFPVQPSAFPIAAMALIDVDRDGDLDLVLCRDARDVQIHLNDGKGLFTEDPTRIMLMGAPRVQRLAWGDLDGDGHTDLLFATGGYRLVVFWNDRQGRFRQDPARLLPPLPDTTLADAALSVALGDVDGDRDLDIVVGTLLRNVLLLNDGRGNFTDVTSTHMPPVTEHTKDLALADVDGDGDLDLLCANWNGQSRLHLNDSRGRFTDATAANMPAGSHPSSRIFTGDINGDGSVDFMLATGIDNLPTPDRICLNDGRGRFGDVTGLFFPAEAAVTTALHLLDLDRDGDLDLLALYQDRHARLYLNGTIGFAHASPRRMSCRQAIPVVADLDGDGHLDLLMDGVLLGNSTGWFRDTDPLAYPAPRWAMATGDVNGDGAPDLVTQGLTGAGLWLNDGRGRFTDATATHLPAQPYRVLSGALGDVDGDGDLDLVVGCLYSSTSKTMLFLNDGTGRFTDATALRLPAAPDEAWVVRLADLDSDGDLDLLVGSSPARARLYLNDGMGFFTDFSARNLPVEASAIETLSIGDVDGDGHLDILAGGHCRPTLLLLNDGQARFTAAQGTGLPSTEARSGLLADLDGDGRPEIVLSLGAEAWRLAIFRSDTPGIPTFREVPGWLPSGLPWVRLLHAADMDADGDLDLLGVPQGPLELTVLLLNLTRQLHAPMLARPGHPYRLDFYGDPARQVALPLVGTARAASQFGRFGLLQLDPQGTRSLPFVTLNSEGKGTLPLAVPRDPVLYGVPLFFQALMIDWIDPGLSRLTNLVVDQVVDV